MLAASGVERTRFGTAPRLAAWAGVAPGNNASAGKQRPSTTRKGQQALRAGRTPWAQAATHTKEPYVSAWYGRRAARRGKQRARMAGAHSMLVRVLHLLTRQEPYPLLGGGYVDETRGH